MQTVLVTGGAGFLGSHICRILRARGDAVVNFDIAKYPDDTLGIVNSPGQINDLPAVIRACRTHAVNGIIHTVALQASNDIPYSTYLINVFGALNVLEATRLAPVGRVVLCSSEAAYQATASEPMNEDHPVFSSSEGAPAAHYGASKAAADVIALTYFSYDGLDVRVCRLSSIYGPGMRASMYIREMVENAVAGIPTRFASGGSMRRDYTHVLDAADGIVRAFDADGTRLRHRLFNIASGRTVTAGDVARVVRSVVSTADIEIGAELSARERQAIKTRGTLDISRAETELGYRPRFDIESGIRQYVETLRRREGKAPVMAAAG